MTEAELRERILASVARERPPTRRAHLLRAWLLFAVGLAASLAIFFAFGGVRPTGRPASLILATSLGAAVVAAFTMWGADVHGGRLLGRPRRWLIALAVLAPLALLIWKIAVSAAYPGGLDEWPERIGLRCLRLSLLLGAWPLIAFLFARRSTPVHPTLAGLAFGVSVGAWTWLLVDLWCPVAFAPHLLLGHVLPLLLLGAAGALAGRWVLSPRVKR